MLNSASTVWCVLEASTGLIVFLLPHSTTSVPPLTLYTSAPSLNIYTSALSLNIYTSAPSLDHLCPPSHYLHLTILLRLMIIPTITPTHLKSSCYGWYSHPPIPSTYSGDSCYGRNVPRHTQASTGNPWSSHIWAGEGGGQVNLVGKSSQRKRV